LKGWQKQDPRCNTARDQADDDAVRKEGVVGCKESGKYTEEDETKRSKTFEENGCCKFLFVLNI